MRVRWSIRVSTPGKASSTLASRDFPKVSVRQRSRTRSAASASSPSARRASARANFPGALVGLAVAK